MPHLVLSDGRTAYEVVGASSDDAPSVLLVSGMTSPSFVWDTAVPALAAHRRVLRYDFYGRGQSDSPRVRYDLSLYLRQLDELVERLLGDRWLAIVGYSWGAGIAAAWASRHARRVARLVLVAPGGLDQPIAARVLALPVAGEILTRIAGPRFVAMDLERGFASHEAGASFVSRVLAQLDAASFSRAFLSTLRHVPGDFRPLYADVGRHGFPVDVLWGSRDAKVPMGLASRLRQSLPRATIHVLEGAAHAMQVEHAEPFNLTLCQLVAQPGPGPGPAPASR
jgi:pimeloyl-ACP methyl ester carboxylesterase